MISAKKLVDELKQKNNNLFESFTHNSKYNFNLRHLRSFKKFQTVIIIGMGGSILGTRAIHSFLKKKNKKKIYFY